MEYGFIEKQLYEKIKKVIPVLCVDLVLHKGSKVLLCFRENEPAKGLWWIPGGRVLKGETLADAVTRKGHEELGLSIEIERLVGIYDWFWDTIHTPSVTYLVRCKDWRGLNLDSQHSNCALIDSLQDNIIPGMLLPLLKDSGVLNK